MSIKRITRKILAAEVAERWLEAYGEDGSGYGNDKVEILLQLRSFGADPSPADVDRIIGNNSWTKVPECNGCGAESQRSVLRIENEYQEFNLCRQCVAKAAALFKIGASK